MILGGSWASQAQPNPVLFISATTINGWRMEQQNWMDEFLKRGNALREEEEKLAKALGLLVMSFNRLERDVGELLAALIQSNDHHTRHALVASMSFGQKVDLIAALYLERFKGNEAQKSLCNSAVKKLHRFEEERNKYIHSWWGTKRFGDTDFIRIKPKTKGGKGLTVLEEQAAPAVLLEVCKQISSFCWLELFELHRACIEQRAQPA